MKRMLLVFVLLIVPFALAMHPSTQPVPSVPGSKIVFVDRGAQVIKSPYTYSIIRKTPDFRRSRYRPETYKMGGDVALLEKPSKPLQYESPVGIVEYGRKGKKTYKSTSGVFRNFKLIYGIDTQVIKKFVREE